MSNTEKAALAALAISLALLLLIPVLRYCFAYAKQVRRAKRAFADAQCWSEKVFWRRELDALRLGALPGLSPERVKAIRRYFYRGRFAQRAEKDDGLGTMLIPSVLSICICMVCLAGGTFAWFTANQTVPAQTIQAATYTVEVVEVRGEQVIAANPDGSYTLEAGTYRVTLTASGTASSGYAIFTWNGVRSFTPQLVNGTHTYEVTLQSHSTPNPDNKLTVVPNWGSYVEGTAPVLQEITDSTAQEAPA